MPARNISVHPFSKAYIGDYGSSSVLTTITSLRTNGAEVEETFPTEYLRALDDAYSYNTIQSGFHEVRITLTFLGDDDLPVRLSRGLSVSADTNSAPGNSNYILFLLSPIETEKNSFYFPRVRTEKVTRLRYAKDEATALQITFVATARNPNTAIIYKDTSTSLDSTMGSVSPI